MNVIDDKVRVVLSDIILHFYKSSNYCSALLLNLFHSVLVIMSILVIVLHFMDVKYHKMQQIKFGNPFLSFS